MASFALMFIIVCVISSVQCTYTQTLRSVNGYRSKTIIFFVFQFENARQTFCWPPLSDRLTERDATKWQRVLFFERKKAKYVVDVSKFLVFFFSALIRRMRICFSSTHLSGLSFIFNSEFRSVKQNSANTKCNKKKYKKKKNKKRICEISTSSYWNSVI